MPEARVLVVDDDTLVSWALGKALSAHALGVDTVETASEGLARVREADYQVAFLDINLPDGNGLDLLPQFRSLAPATRFVMLTCAESDANRQCAFERGAWQFVAKPFELAEVVGLVKSTLGDFATRRSCDRRLCRIPLRLTLLQASLGAAGLEYADATALDVSPDGLRLRTDLPLQPGARVQVTPMGGDRCCASFVRQNAPAEVVWVTPDAEGVTAGLRYPR